MMTFIVTLIALLVERFFDWSHIRQWSWFKNYQYAIVQYYKKSSPYLILAIILIPMIACVGLLQLLLDDWLYGFVSLVFQLVLLIYCLGPSNLWADGFASMHALAEQNDGSGKVLAVAIDETDQKHKQLLNNIFIEANRRVFAVIFWYILLGPVGAVLYRTVTITANEKFPEIEEVANQFEDLLDWLPARLFTFLFALGGHFVSVLTCWRKKVLVGLSDNEIILTECGSAALGDNDENQVAEGAVQRNAISLLDRVFIITLVIIALSVLLG